MSGTPSPSEDHEWNYYIGILLSTIRRVQNPVTKATIPVFTALDEAQIITETHPTLCVCVLRKVGQLVGWSVGRLVCWYLSVSVCLCLSKFVCLCLCLLVCMYVGSLCRMCMHLGIDVWEVFFQGRQKSILSPNQKLDRIFFLIFSHFSV